MWTAGAGTPPAGTAGFRAPARGAVQFGPGGLSLEPAGRVPGRRWTGRREASGRLTASGAFGQPPPAAGGRPGDGTASPAILRTLFEEAAAGLTLGEREVIELQLRQGLAPHEVAAVLGVSGRRARQLQARAREQLEVSLGVLLVGRAARGECRTLRSLLTGWDGQLTAGLRKQVGRHIDRCATCTATRATQLRPARLLNLPPGAALAAGAAQSLRLTLGAPAGLRARTMSLAAGHGPVAAASRATVLARAGTFGAGGFPRPAGPASAGLARPALAGPRGLAALRTALRTTRSGRVAMAAATVLSVATAAVAVAPGPAVTHPCPASKVSLRGATLAACTSWTRSLGGRLAGGPLPETHRPLRSWIEPNRLR